MSPPPRIVHHNPWFSITHREDWQTVGAAGWYRIVRPDSVIVVPTLADGRLVMIHGRRDTTGSEAFYELPAGGIEPGESPEAAGARELLEETGHRAVSTVRLGAFVESPALSASQCIAVAVTCEAQGSQALESGETWSVETIAPDELGGLIAAGRIVDGTTLAALHLWSLIRAKR